LNAVNGLIGLPRIHVPNQSISPVFVMLDVSDPFDDDGFFAHIDFAALEAVEAQAITATQGVKKPSRPAPAASLKLQKDPRPINTEPRAGGKSTFGFGELGKHTHPANETRYVDGVEKRKQYWGLKRDDDDEDGDGYPVVTIDSTGQYGLARDDDDDEQVVDTHAPGGRGVAYTRAVALQRDTISTNTGPDNVAGPSRARPSSPIKGMQSNQQSGPNGAAQAASSRILSRSASVGKQVFAPRPSRLQPGLGPILSQSNGSQPTSSQGSQARRSVLLLDDEKRRREELEREVERLQTQLQASKSHSRHWTDGLQVDMGPGKPEDRVRDLQAQLWKASGEAETIRRLQKTVGTGQDSALTIQDVEKHRAEIDQLKANIAERDRLLAEKERENIARVESVKSQAIFAVRELAHRCPAAC
jgi:hypothetical protein